MFCLHHHLTNTPQLLTAHPPTTNYHLRQMYLHSGLLIMRITNAFPNFRLITKVNKQTYKVNNVKYKITNLSVTAKPTRLYLEPKQEL